MGGGASSAAAAAAKADSNAAQKNKPFFTKDVLLRLPPAWASATDANKIDFLLTFFRSGEQVMMEDARRRDVPPGGELLHFHSQRLEEFSSATIYHVTRRVGSAAQPAVENFSTLWVAAPPSETRDCVAWTVHATAPVAAASEGHYADADSLKADAYIGFHVEWRLKVIQNRNSGAPSINIAATHTVRVLAYSTSVPMALLQRELDRLKSGLFRLCDWREQAFANFAKKGGRPAGRWAEPAPPTANQQQQHHQQQQQQLKAAAACKVPAPSSAPRAAQPSSAPTSSDPDPSAIQVAIATLGGSVGAEPLSGHAPPTYGAAMGHATGVGGSSGTASSMPAKAPLFTVAPPARKRSAPLPALPGRPLLPPVAPVGGAGAGTPLRSAPPLPSRPMLIPSPLPVDQAAPSRVSS